MFSKKIGLFIASLLLVTSAKAQESNFAAKATEKGMYELAGTFSMASSSLGTTVSINPAISYFFWDKTQIGFGGTLNNSSDFNTTGNVGLSAAHYFFTEKNLGSFIEQSFFTTYGQVTNNQSAATSFGVAFFATPNVAFKTVGALSYPVQGVVTFTLNVSGGLAFYF